jgi:hypothetical protein
MLNNNELRKVLKLLLSITTFWEQKEVNVISISEI